MPPREGVRAADEGAGRAAVAEPARRPRLSPALPRAVLRRRNAGASWIHKSWERIREQAELPHLRIHDLRHQYASFLVNSGRSLYEAQKILGHSNHTVTERYAHLSSRALMEAANSASTFLLRPQAEQATEAARAAAQEAAPKAA
jgi:integrase